MGEKSNFYSILKESKVYVIIKKIINTFLNILELVVNTFCDLIYSIFLVVFFIPKFFIVLISKLKDRINKDSIGILFGSIIDLMVKFIQLIIEIPKNIISIILEYFNKTNENIKKRIDVYKAEKLAQKYIWMLKQCILLNSTIFTDLGYHYFILIITIGLQFISVFTTFRGVHYYFGNITIPKWIAPFIITLLIQGTLILLSNTLIYKNKMNKRRYFALFLVCLISIFFSYTGLVNNVIQPNKDMKVNYNEFYDKFDGEYKKYKAKYSSDKSIVDNFNDKYNHLKVLCNEKISELDLEINKMGEETTETEEQGPNGLIITNRNKPNPEKDKKKGQRDKIKDNLSNLETTYKNIKTDINSLSNNITENEMENQLKILDNNENIKKYINNYNFTVSNIKVVDNKIDISPIINLQTEYYDFKSSTEEIKIDKYDTIISNLKTKYNHEINEMNLEDLSYISNEIVENIEKYEKSSLCENKSKDEGIEAVNIAALKAKEIEDFNIKTIEYFFSNIYRSKALSMLVAAIFIDGMTVLLPLLLEIPKKCILYVRSRKHLIYEEEEIIEKLLEANSPIDSHFINNVINLRDKLIEFLNLFEFSHREALENGYSQYCNKSNMDNFIKKNRNLFAFITFLKVVEYLYYDEEDVLYIKNNNETKNNYYMRTKFVLWLSECISSLNRYIENNTIIDSMIIHESNDKHDFSSKGGS